MVGDYMKALNRKEVLVNAKANGTLDSFKPLTRDEAFTKKALGLGGGASSWNDLTDKPFYEEITNYPFTVLYDNGDGEQGHSWELKIDNFNVKSSYRVEIRGDVYSNLAPYVVSDYYVNYVWGDMEEFLFYPFRMMTPRGAGKNDTFWNEDGFFVGGSGVYEYGITFYVDTTKYPDLDIATEVKIYKQEVKTLDPKYLPTAVVNITVDEEAGSITADLSATEIANLVSAGVNVIAVDNMGGVYYSDDIHKDTDGTGAVRFHKVMWDYGVHRGYIRLTWTGDNKTVNIERGGIESVLMMSPNGTVYTVTVDDNGTLKAEAN